MNDCIRPGREWLDTEGKRIEAHGGTMFYEDGVYYWLGEDKSHTRKKGKNWTWGIKLYASRDLYNWKDEGHIVEPVLDDKRSQFYPTRRLDRPHLLKNPHTGKYVLWVKYCDGAHYSVLTADTIRGPYTLVVPFLQPFGHKSGDFDLALDEASGIAYLYFEADHDKLLVTKLNQTFTGVEGMPKVVYESLKPPLTREAPAHFMRNGRHYLITSGMTGYVPNPTEIAVADDWMGPFTVLGDPCVDDASSASFNSQPSHVFRVAGTDTLVMMADRWVPDFVMTKERYDSFFRAIYGRVDRSLRPSLKDSFQMLTSPMMGSADTSRANYVWLPFDWDGDMPRLNWRDEWKL
jgi:hypothetical protein